MNDTPPYGSHHPAMRLIAATGLAAAAIDRTAYRFTHRPAPRAQGQPRKSN